MRQGHRPRAEQAGDSPQSARKCRALGCCARERRPWIQPLRTVGAVQAAPPRGPASPKSLGSNSPCWEAQKEEVTWARFQENSRSEMVLLLFGGQGTSLGRSHSLPTQASGKWQVTTSASPSGPGKITSAHQGTALGEELGYKSKFINPVGCLLQKSSPQKSTVSFTSESPTLTRTLVRPRRSPQPIELLSWAGKVHQGTHPPPGIPTPAPQHTCCVRPPHSSHLVKSFTTPLRAHRPHKADTSPLKLAVANSPHPSSTGYGCPRDYHAVSYICCRSVTFSFTAEFPQGVWETRHCLLPKALLAGAVIHSEPSSAKPTAVRASACPATPQGILFSYSLTLKL